LALTRSLHEIIGFGSNPGDKNCDVRVSQQGLHRVKLPGQFSFGEERMYLTMAYAMQVLGKSAAFGSWYQMMGVALTFGNLAFAQRTDQVHRRSHDPIFLK
jgi:hypothetical protein